MLDDKSRFLMYELCDDEALKRKRPKTKLCKKTKFCKKNKTLQETKLCKKQNFAKNKTLQKTNDK